MFSLELLVGRRIRSCLAEEVAGQEDRDLVFAMGGGVAAVR